MSSDQQGTMMTLVLILVGCVLSLIVIYGLIDGPAGILVGFIPVTIAIIVVSIIKSRL